jgi:hypothetical protein
MLPRQDSKKCSKNFEENTCRKMITLTTVIQSFTFTVTAEPSDGVIKISSKSWHLEPNIVIIKSLRLLIVKN